MPTPPDRSDFPIPDPQESLIRSNRADHNDPSANWLPDISAVANVPEVDLEPWDALDPSKFTSCPDKASQPAGIPAAARVMAQWVFDTYAELVRQRLKVYNSYRLKMNAGDPDPNTPGRYRKACRLATEQLIRRDLPPIPGLDWNFWDPALPVFELILTIEHVTGQPGSPNPPNYELVTTITIQGVVEIRQHNEEISTGTVTLATDDEEWSSSSSSSSSSESSIDP